MPHTFKINISFLFGLIFLLSLLIPTASARSVYESYIINDPHKLEFVGALSGAQFGAEIASGDLNGDGIEDLIVSSPFASTGLKDWNGMVSIVYGRKTLETRNFDFSEVNADINIYGEHSGDQLGTSLSVGDYNNDGISDLAIGAYNAHYAEKRPGKVYVFYGARTWGKQAIDLSTQNPDVLFVGYADGDAFGLALETLDMNNDSIDDLLIGSPFASTMELNNCGMVYLYYSDENGFSANKYVLSERQADVSFHGQASNEKFGASISGGNINADEKTDLVVGAYKSGSDLLYEAGKVYFYNGKDVFLKNEKIPTSFLSGTNENGWLGFSIDVGDINNDSWDDIAITSFPYLGDRGLAEIAIYFGGNRFFHEGAEYENSDNLADIRISDPTGENLLGAEVLLTDLNNDNKADILAGAPGIGGAKSIEEGDLYLIYSSNAEYEDFYSIKDKSVTSTIHGENADDWFGYSAESLDFNDDGHKDLVIGSRYSEGTDSINNGKVFVLLGNDVPYGDLVTVLNPQDRYITRGEFVARVVNDFSLAESRSDFITSCYDYKDFCLFNFTAMSLYDELKLDPELVLYPDVPVTSQYYEEITIATILGLINGYMNEDNSPFHPELNVSRIQALKVILGALDAVEPMYRFELLEELGGYTGLISQKSYFIDVDPQILHMWWYPRYINFAVENDIIDDTDFFRPDDFITVGEFDKMIERAIKYLENEKTNS